MKTTVLICTLCLLLGGCTRKSELEKTRASLDEAQRTIAKLESERVPRAQYDVMLASLQIADARIATLEHDLKVARDAGADKQARASSDTAPNQTSQPTSAATPSNLRLVNGGYVEANGTYVYSPDSELEYGQHLKVSSPSGLMVSDPDLRVVGGDLNIKMNGGTVETTDGLLSTQPDGTVNFVGKTLVMKFDETKEPANQPADTKNQDQQTISPASAQTPAEEAQPSSNPR